MNDTDVGYTLLGFDEETRMHTYAECVEDIDAAHAFAEDKQLGPWLIYARNPASYASNLHLICYLRKPSEVRANLGPEARQYYPVALCEWVYRAHSFAQRFAPKGSPLFREIYGEDERR